MAVSVDAKSNYTERIIIPSCSSTVSLTLKNISSPVWSFTRRVIVSGSVFASSPILFLCALFDVTNVVFADTYQYSPYLPFQSMFFMLHQRVRTKPDYRTLPSHPLHTLRPLPFPSPISLSSFLLPSPRPSSLPPSSSSPLPPSLLPLHFLSNPSHTHNTHTPFKFGDFHLPYNMVKCLRRR